MTRVYIYFLKQIALQLGSELNESWMNSSSNVASVVMAVLRFNRVFVCTRWSEVKNFGGKSAFRLAASRI